MLVRDLMQKDVVTLNRSDSLGLADDIMRLGRIRHMPVVEDDRPIGILSQRDLFRAAISSVLEFRPSAEREWLAQIRVSEIMTSPVLTVSPDDTVQTAARWMAERRVGCLPVVENERLCGLLSETDCMRYLVRVLDEADVAAKRSAGSC